MKTTVALPLAVLIALALLLASLPYLVGLSMETDATEFAGLTWNIDDACVYVSWIRQIADGNILFRNNFTNDPQRAIQFNLLFTAMGLSSRVTGISPTAVLHIFRLLLGAGLLLVAWRFARLFIADERKRLFFLGILAFSSGFGWILPERGHQGPIDTWQPEAITFLSLYLNPLFLAGQILMLAALYFLLTARMSGTLRPAALAGLMLLLLANIHSYDLVIVGGVWAAYIAASCVLERKILWRPILLSLFAGAIALPAIGYQLHLYLTDTVFRLRANTAAPSPVVWSYFLGYGAVLIAAAFAIPRVVRNRKGLLLAAWVVVGFMLPYLPFAQQRKFVMGLHVPLAILAVIALWPLARRVSWRNARSFAAAFVLFTAIGNVYFLQRDIKWLQQYRTAAVYSPFLLKSEVRAFEWLRANTRPSATVFAAPDIALLVPALSGNRVYYGHWSETPDYANRRMEWMLYAAAATPESVRLAILRHSGAEYIVHTRVPGLAGIADLSSEPYLSQVYSNGPTSIYRVAVPD